MARIHMPGLDMTLEAAADLSTHQFKFVIGAAAVAGGQLARVNVSGANGRAIGILQNKPNAAGLGAVVRTSGRAGPVRQRSRPGPCRRRPKATPLRSIAANRRL